MIGQKLMAVTFLDKVFKWFLDFILLIFLILVYFETFLDHLNEHISGGDFLDFMIALTNSNRNDTAAVSEDKAKEYAHRLLKAGKDL